MSNGSDDDNKTRRLDDDYFKKIASRATSAPSGSDDDKTRLKYLPLSQKVIKPKFIGQMPNQPNPNPN